MTTARSADEFRYRPSLRDLYNAHQPLLEKFARRRVDDPAVVEDLCQLTWIGYDRWCDQHPDEPVRNVAGFLVNILRYQLKTYFRKLGKSEICVEDDIFVESEHRLLMPAFGHSQPDVDARIDLAAALAELKPRVRLAFMLNVVDGLPAADVAYVLNVTPGRVYQLLAEGRQTLAQSPHLSSYRTANNQEGRDA